MPLVRYESAERVATITMERREKHNALNGALRGAAPGLDTVSR